MSVFLPAKDLELVRKILRKHGLQDAKVFGSRARGDHKEYSDLDLVVQRDQALAPKVLMQIKNDFAESDLTFTVDIVEWLRISEDFRKAIASELVDL